jgi:hypothetical protein
MLFTVDELDAKDLPWTAEHISSRGKGKTGENVDLVFRHDWVSYHVMMHIAPDGSQTYPDAVDGVVDCPEVELYSTTRPGIQFRKVTDGTALSDSL